MSAQLFISHANEDAKVADRIVTYLESHGVSCWISSRDIPPQKIYADAIAEAMQACSACAVLVSRVANQSKAVKRELELASHYDKPFIPIRIDAAEPTAAVGYYLRNTQWLDHRRDGERALERIVAQVQDAPHAPTTVSPRPSFVARVLAGLILLIVAGGGWFVWRLQRQPAQTALPIELAGSQLTGSYHWDGVACGNGPTITQENGALVFAMPGTPTYRHTVLSAERNVGGYELRVVTRVAAPAESEGLVYTIGINRGAKSVDVISRDRTDSWQRCGPRTTGR